MAAHAKDTQIQLEKDVKNLQENAGLVDQNEKAAQSFNSKPEMYNEILSLIRKGVLDSHSIYELSINNKLLKVDDMSKAYINMITHDLANLLQENYPIKELILYIYETKPEYLSRLFSMIPYNKHIQILSIFSAVDYSEEDARNLITNLLKALTAEEIEASNTKLTTLDIRGCGISCSEAELLSGFLKENTVLTSLSLRNNNIHGKGFVAICHALHHNRILRSLDMSNNWAQVEGLYALGNLLKANSTLTNLNLEDIDFNDDNKDNVDNDEFGGDDDVIDHPFANSNNVTTLIEGFACHKTPLTELNIGENQFSKDTITMLTTSLQFHPTIQAIYIYRAFPFMSEQNKEINITAISLSVTHLCQIPSLTILDCSGNDLTSEGVRSLKMGLKNNTTITTLNCCSSHISEKDAKEIAEIIENNNTLSDLDLSNNLIGITGILCLATALQKNRSLFNLVLAGCNLEGKITVKPCKAHTTTKVKSDCQLKILDFSNNHLNLQDTYILVEALDSNCSLTNLRLDVASDLSSNGIQDICTSLQSQKSDTISHLNKTGSSAKPLTLNQTIYPGNRNLTILSLSSCMMRDAHANHLAQLIENNTSLERLELRYHQFSKEGIKKIALAVQKNKTLIEIDITLEDLNNKDSAEENAAKWKLYAEIAARCEANRIKRATLQSNWGRACTVISFSRAHQHLPSFHASILPLLPTIQAFADFDEGIPKEQIQNKLMKK